MRTRSILLCGILVGALCACQPQGPQPVNPKATKEARELLAFLYTFHPSLRNPCRRHLRLSASGTAAREPESHERSP